jgi:hypothetical protein
MFLSQTKILLVVHFLSVGVDEVEYFVDENKDGEYDEYPAYDARPYEEKAEGDESYADVE